eukprot:Rmarinus@m.18272
MSDLQASADREKQLQEQVSRVREPTEALTAYWRNVRGILSPVEVMDAFPKLAREVQKLIGEAAILSSPESSFSLKLPALQAMAYTKEDRPVAKRMFPVSGSFPIPEGNGVGVCLAYDDVRDAVWVITSERLVGCFLVGCSRWMGRWSRLEETISGEEGVVDFDVSGNGMILVIPTLRTTLCFLQITRYDPVRHTLTSIDGSNMSRNGKLFGQAVFFEDGKYAWCPEQSRVVVVGTNEYVMNFIVTCLNVSTDGQFVLAGGYGAMAMLDVHSDSASPPAAEVIKIPFCSIDDSVKDITMGNDRLVIITDSNIIYIVHVKTRVTHAVPYIFGGVSSIALNGKGSLLALGFNGHVRLLELPSAIEESSAFERSFLHVHEAECQKCRRNQDNFTYRDLFGAVKEGFHHCIVFIHYKTRGAFTNATDENNDNVAHLAARIGDVKVLKYFLEGVGTSDLAFARGMNGDTIYHAAASAQNCTDVYKYLGNMGMAALLSESNDFQHTIMHSLASFGNLSGIQCLAEEYSGEVLLRCLDRDRCTVSDIARQHGHLNICEYIGSIEF